MEVYKVSTLKLINAEPHFDTGQTAVVLKFAGRIGTARLMWRSTEEQLVPKDLRDFPFPEALVAFLEDVCAHGIINSIAYSPETHGESRDPRRRSDSSQNSYLTIIFQAVDRRAATNRQQQFAAFVKILEGHSKVKPDPAVLVSRPKMAATKPYMTTAFGRLM